MNILWLSPFDRGRAVTRLLAGGGHQVHYTTAHEPAAWGHLLDQADLIVCDEEFPSRKTRRSWSPSDASLALQRRPSPAVPYVGPLPTTELLAHDARYLKKVCTRLGVRGEGEGQAVKDPDGQWMTEPLPEWATPLDALLDRLGLRSYRAFGFGGGTIQAVRCGMFW